jgi:hypothetical protein
MRDQIDFPGTGRLKTTGTADFKWLGERPWV